MIGGHWIGMRIIARPSPLLEVRSDWCDDVSAEQGEGRVIAAGFTCPYCGAKDAFLMMKREGELPFVRCELTKREFWVPLTKRGLHGQNLTS